MRTSFSVAGLSSRGRVLGCALFAGLALAACSSTSHPASEGTGLPDTGSLPITLPDAGFPAVDGSVYRPDTGAFLPDTGVARPDVDVVANKFGCNTDANCSGDLHCDTRAGSITQGECVVCLASSQCQNSQVCDPAAGTCVFDCRLQGSPTCETGRCDPASGACVECETDQDCVGATNGPLCNPTNHACVDCLGLSDCKDVLAPGCSNGHCGSCLSAADCAPHQDCVASGGSTTTFAPGACQCTSDEGCGVGQPVCVGLSFGGVDGQPIFSGCGCKANSDCKTGEHCDVGDSNQCVPSCTVTGCGFDDTPACDQATGLCVACNTDDDCSDDDSTPACDTATHTCVGCTSNDECDDENQVCTAMHVCGPCTADGQCEGSEYGSVCGSGACGCHADSDCASLASGEDAGAEAGGGVYCALPTSGSGLGTCQLL